MIIYITQRAQTNMLDFLEITIKKIEGSFNFKSFVKQSMPNYLYCNDIVIQRHAFEDTDEDFIIALKEFTTSYSTRITIIYEGLCITMPFMLELLKNGVTNLITAKNIRDIQEELKAALSTNGLDTYAQYIKEELVLMHTATDEIIRIKEKMQIIEKSMLEKITMAIEPIVDDAASEEKDNSEQKAHIKKSKSDNKKKAVEKRSFFKKPSALELTMKDIAFKAEKYSNTKLIVSKYAENISTFFCMYDENGDFAQCLDKVDIICESEKDSVKEFIEELKISPLSPRVLIDWDFFNKGV